MRKPELSSVQRYIEELYAVEDGPLAAVRERLIAAGKWGINVDASEGRILQILTRLVGAKKIVEVGTLFGYSTVWLARAVDKTGIVYTIERDHDAVQMAKKAFVECGVSDRVRLLEGEANERLSEIASEGPFDLVFIDANKSGYVDYLNWAEANLRVGGVLVADNTLLGGAIGEKEKPERISNGQWRAIRDFNRALASEKFIATILPTSEGLSVAIKLR